MRDFEPRFSYSKRPPTIFRALPFVSLAFLILLGIHYFGAQPLDGAIGFTEPDRTVAFAYPMVSATPSQTPEPCGMNWDVLNSANPGSTSNYLFNVAAVSANDVWAVGNFNNNPSASAMIQHWNGSSWSLASNPSPGTTNNVLIDIEVVSADDIWAVGYFSSAAPWQTLVEHWNGTAWSVVPSPNTGPTMDNVLRHIEVVSANDAWAVGFYGGTDGHAHPLIEHWNGTAWAIIPGPNPSAWGSDLWGVSAVSSNDVWAVGSYSDQGTQRTLIEHWDGTSWSITPSPNADTEAYTDNVLMSVDAVSGGDLWAVGYYTSDLYGIRTLTLHWDSSAWRVVPSPSGGTRDAYLFSVAAVASNNVWAVGYYMTPSRNETQVLHWDGAAWSLVSSPSPAAYSNILKGVAVTSNGDLWAVGYARNCFSGCPFTTLVERYADTCPPATVEFVGHVVWQGPPAPPDTLQELPITMTLRWDGNEIDLPPRTTNDGGFFTMTIPYQAGSYQWRVKGPKYLAKSGSMVLTDKNVQASSIMSIGEDMGEMKAGDANNDNIINVSDLNILKRTFGLSSGQNGYDDRAEFDGDEVVNMRDFNLLKVNFGLSGSP